jgi:phage terminase small subunit
MSKMMMDNRERTDNCTSEQLSEILDELTHNQLRFVVAMMESANKKEAAAAIGLTPSTVYRWPASVDTAIELMRISMVDSAREMLVKSVTKAALVKVAGLNDDNPKVRHAAASEVLDRVLGKPTQPQDIKTGGTQEIVVRYDRSQPIHPASEPTEDT